MCGNVLQDIISSSAELRTVPHPYAVVLKFVNLYVLDFSHSLSPILISLLPPFAVPTRGRGEAITNCLGPGSPSGGLWSDYVAHVFVFLNTRSVRKVRYKGLKHVQHF